MPETWKEKLRLLAPGWRTTLPGFLDSTEEIDDLVERDALAAIPELTKIVTNEQEKNDRRYRAIRYLLVFHDEGKIPADDLLHLLSPIARSRPDQEYYQPRRDTMTALTYLRSGTGLGFRLTDPRAIEILTAIAADQQSPDHSRRDALEVLARADTIRALAPDKVESVLKVLLSAMTSPSGNRSAGEIVVQGIRQIKSVSWRDKAGRLLEWLKDRPLARGDIDVVPPRRRDFKRQYNLKPARCQRTMVSGLTIASASQTLGNSR